MFDEAAALVVHPGDTVGGAETLAPAGGCLPYASSPVRSSNSVLRSGGVGADGGADGGSSTCAICLIELPSPAALAQHRGGELHRVRRTTACFRQILWPSLQVEGIDTRVLREKLISLLTRMLSHTCICK